jgi:hypothetical protein
LKIYRSYWIDENGKRHYHSDRIANRPYGDFICNPTTIADMAAYASYLEVFDIPDEGTPVITLKAKDAIIGMKVLFCHVDFGTQAQRKQINKLLVPGTIYEIQTVVPDNSSGYYGHIELVEVPGKFFRPTFFSPA